MGITAYESSMAITQLKGAAREFAQDLMDIRARALAGSDSGFLVVSSGRKGYWVYRRPNLVVKSRDFASAGTGFLQFSSVPAYIIRFSINGSPSASGKFVLKHNRIPSAQIHINLQPVTGRIRTEHVRL